MTLVYSHAIIRISRIGDNSLIFQSFTLCNFVKASIDLMSKPSTPQPSNTLLLRRQLTELTKHPVEGFSAGAGSLSP